MGAWTAIRGAVLLVFLHGLVGRSSGNELLTEAGLVTAIVILL
jgi:hypothetical protein